MSNHIKRFIYNTLVDRPNLCNLAKEARVLEAALDSSDKVVIYGKRDSGKTSLIKNIVLPDWLEKTPNGMAIYAELYGVKSVNDIAEKLTLYYNKAYQGSFALRATLKSSVQAITGIRPSFAMSPDGTLEASLTSERNRSIPKIETFFSNIKLLHDRGVRVAIVFDEFQDIALAIGGEDILREEMQKLPFEIPVIILGSKQHLLAKLFQKPKAPFFNWGKRLEIRALPIDEYNAYIAERFALHQINATNDILCELQRTLLYNPEAINMFCSHLVYHLGNQKINQGNLTLEILHILLKEYVAALGSEFEFYLDSYTKNEVKVLTYIAKQGTLTNPLGKETLAALNISAGGLRKILTKLLDHADIYRDDGKLTLSKPLLMHYLREWRL